MNGILILGSVTEAIRAGFEILSVYPDGEGFLHARTRTPAGWALALIAARPHQPK